MLVKNFNRLMLSEESMLLLKRVIKNENFESIIFHKDNFIFHSSEKDEIVKCIVSKVESYKRNINNSKNILLEIVNELTSNY